MVSHKKFGGIELSIGAGGLRFKKRPSAYNICIGKQLKGKSYAHGGRYSKEVQAAFKAAVVSCK